jgi:hypothetical protein
MPVVGPAIGPRGREIDLPEWQRDHMRAIIDAISGQLLFAINRPQPDIFETE